MNAQKTSWWWLPWAMIVLTLAMILGCFYYGGTTLGLPMVVGATVGSIAAFTRRTRT